MNYELAGFIYALIVLVIDPDCISSRLNVGGLLWPWKVEELPLKEASERGPTGDFGQYFGIGGSVLAQQL